MALTGLPPIRDVYASRVCRSPSALTLPTMLIHKLSNYALVNVQRMLRLKRVFGFPYHVVLDPTNWEE